MNSRKGVDCHHNWNSKFGSVADLLLQVGCSFLQQLQVLRKKHKISEGHFGALCLTSDLSSVGCW